MLLLVVKVIDNLMLFYLIAFSAMQGSVFRRLCFINKSKVCVCVYVCVLQRFHFSSQFYNCSATAVAIFICIYIRVHSHPSCFLPFLCLRRLMDLLVRMKAFLYSSSCLTEEWWYWTYKVLVKHSNFQGLNNYSPQDYV